MKQGDKKIRSFTDLSTWQKGHTFVLEIYKVTQLFPKEEAFILTSQLRRAAISFTSNIAEGFSRRTYKDKSRFYNTALGSLTETQSQLLIARDLGYIKSLKFDKLAEQTIELNKMTNGLIKASQKRS